MSVKILNPGLYASVQDLGRKGYGSQGVPISGVMDRYSAKIANLLVGNPASAAVIEMALQGPKLEFQESNLIALTGLAAKVTLNEERITLNEVHPVEVGDVLHIQAILKGARLYLSVGGGFLTKKIMGSRSFYEPVTSTNQLEKETSIPIYHRDNELNSVHAVVKFDRKKYVNQKLKVFPGPEFQLFSAEEKTELLLRTFSVSKNNSRMAYQLKEPFENNLKPILTQPVLPGTVQLTPQGNLIILMRDCQTTGGYPRIFQLTNKSISLLAQKVAGDEVSFQLKS